MKFYRRLPLSTLLLSILIVGCAPSTGIQDPTLTPAQIHQAKVEKLTEKSAKAEEPQKSLLNAELAQLLIANNEFDKAVSVIYDIDLNAIDSDTRYFLINFSAREKIKSRELQEAINLASYILASDEAILTPEQKIALLSLKLQAEEGLNLPFQSIYTLISLQQLQQTNEETQSIHNHIWEILTAIPVVEVQIKLSATNNSYREQGWYELYYELTKSTQLDQQYQTFKNWQSAWQQHPAAAVPPSALAQLDLSSLTINKVAILLPMEGKYARPAQAIKEGLLMAHYRQQQRDGNPPELIFLDSNQINSPYQLNMLLSDIQADLVIGPLDKEFVTAIATDTEFTTPVLALNYSDEIYREGLYQFGLAVEDEARQMAKKAWSDGIKSTSILIPTSSWGKRVKESFTAQFEELGGTISSTASFADTAEFSTIVSHLLNTDQSSQRYQQLRQTIPSRKIEFEEHRRTDIDAIILTALPNDARQLSPILAFNFAGDLPVYASSHIYSGAPDPVLDQDLNKITFTDIPWNLKPASQDKILLSQQRENTTTRLGRFYAMGLDAYRIYPYLRQLSAIPGTEISGETGTLSLNKKGQVERSLLWAKYKDGTPYLLEE